MKMQGKRLLGFMVALSVFGTFLTACGKQEVQTSAAMDGPVTIGMITGMGGIGDKSYNQSAYEGLQELQNTLGGSKVGLNIYDSVSEADYATNMEKASSENNDLVWALGYHFSDLLKEAALKNPNRRYAIVDYSYGKETPKNAVGIIFRSEEGSFLAGYIAGRMSKTNKVGFVGGEFGQAISDFEYGYKAGVAMAGKVLSKNIEVVSEYAESFADPDKGKAIATSMYAQGVDIIFHASGGTGDGVIEAAKEQDKWVIGVDRDQSYLAPNNVVASVIKNVGQAVKIVSEQMITEGKFRGGSTEKYGIVDSAVGIAYSENALVSNDIRKATEALEEQVAGKVWKIPTTKEEYETFIGALK